MKASRLLLLVLCATFVSAWAQQATRMHRLALPNQQQLPVAHVHRIMQDSHGFMWYATEGGGVCRDNAYSVDVFRPSQLGAAGGNKSDNVLCLTEGVDGSVWFGTDSGLFRIDGETFSLSEPDSTLRSATVHSVSCVSDGTLWVGVHSALLHLSPSGERLGTYEMRDTLGHPLLVPCLIEHSDGTLMGCASWNVGLFRYDAVGDSIKFMPWGMEGSPQWMVEDEANHCLWVATWGAGVVKYLDNRAEPQAVYTAPTEEREGITTYVSLDEKGHLWVCGLDNLSTFSTNEAELKVIDVAAVPKDERMTVDATLCDSRGNVWVVGSSPTGFVLKPQDNRYRRIPLSATHRGLDDSSVPERVAVSGTDTWLYVLRFGIACLNARGDTLALSSDEQSGPPLGQVFTPDAEGEGVWASRSKDLLHLRRRGAGLEVEKVSYLGQDVYSMLADGSGNVWINGYNGLQRFDIASSHPAMLQQEADSIFAEPRLPTRLPAVEHLIKTIKDDEGNDWALTNKHAYYFKTSGAGQGHLTSCAFPCGLPDIGIDYFTDICFVPGRGAVLAGPGALVEVDTRDFSSDEATLRPLVASLTYNGERHVLSATTDRLRLPANARDINIEFTTLDYLLAPYVEWEYSLDKGEWTSLPEGEDALHFTSLRPGSLRIDVKATPPGSFQSTEVFSLTVVRTPYWWETWWFRSLVVLAIIGMAVGATALYRRQKEREKERMRHWLALFQPEEQKLLERDKLSEADKQFLSRAQNVVEQHIDDESYDVDAFSRDLAMSRSNLYRKLQTISGQKPKEFIRNTRLSRATQLLKEGNMSVAEVATAVGFGYVSYFCRCFKAMYGVQPKQYQQDYFGTKS